MLKTIAIVGVGLIGTSYALAYRRAHPNVVIFGVDPSDAFLRAAIDRSAIDRIATLEEAATADLILLAVPVRQMPALLKRLAHLAGENSVIVDAGSTKQDVVAAARLALGARFGQFVPCHPIAGRERHGPMAADPTLFDGKNVVLCAQPENSPNALDRARQAWETVGARVVEMPAVAHDAVFAAVSHLPHMLAFALVEELASRPNAQLLFEHAASGFRDFTRIASSSPEMWRDVAINNRDALLAELDVYSAKVNVLRGLIAAGDEKALQKFLERAQLAREHWLSGQIDQINSGPSS
jgi:prephenate dehydrogenase